MKRPAAIFFASVLLCSCPGPLDRGSLRTGNLTVGLSLPGSSASRTIVPDYSSAMTRIAKLQATLTSDGQSDLSAIDSNGAPWELGFNPAPGSWDITVVLLDATGAEIGRGTLPDFQVTSGSASIAAVPITFNPVGSTGDVSFKLSVPATTGVDYVHGALLEPPSTVVVKALTTSGERKTGDLAFSSLNPGTYTLKLTFRRDGSTGPVAGIFLEKIVVVGGYTSTCWVTANGTLAAERTFTAAEFLEVPSFNLSFTGGVASVTMLPSVASFDVGTIDSLPSTITFTATEVSAGLSLRYRWNKGLFTSVGTDGKSGDLNIAVCNELEIEATKAGTTTYHRVTFSKPLTNGNTYSFPGSGGAATMSVNSDGTVTISGSDSGVTSVDIPAYIGGHKVTKIADNAFMDRTALTTINIPDSITSIGAHAFLRCSSLTSLVIPDSVTTISDGSIQDCTSMTSVVIPNKVETIVWYAFYNDTALKSVDLPASIKTIGAFAFHGNSSLTVVHVRATKPPTLSENVFTGTLPPSRTIYVPLASVGAYKSDTWWSAYAASIVGE